MENKSKLRLAWVLALLWLGSGIAGATTFLRFQSTCLGEGWFQYQVNVLNDPFFSEVDTIGLQIDFTNQIDHGAPPDGWVVGPGRGSSWETTNSYPSRPYELTFLIRSAETSYRLNTNRVWFGPYGAVVSFTLFCTDLYPGFASAPTNCYPSILGIAGMPCLVPCPPEAADDSPTNFVFELKLLPDITINRLLQNNGEIHGVDFIWAEQSTLVLQGSPDMNAWTNLAYIWSWPPETVWTTDAALNPYGQFFRVALVADGHVSDLPPLTSGLSSAPKTVATTNRAVTTPRVTDCRLARGKVVVNIASQAGQTALVQAMDSHRVVRQTRQIVASSISATVSFDAATLPSPVFFQAIAVQ